MKLYVSVWRISRPGEPVHFSCTEGTTPERVLDMDGERHWKLVHNMVLDSDYFTYPLDTLDLPVHLLHGVAA